MPDFSVKVSDPRTATNEPSELLRAASHLADLMDDLGKSIVVLEDRLAPIIFDGPQAEDGEAKPAQGPNLIPRHSAVLTRLSNVADGIESLCHRVDQITTNLRV